MTKRIEIKNLGLIKTAIIDLKKVNIIIGEKYKSDILEIIYWLDTIEKKYFNYKLKYPYPTAPVEFCEKYSKLTKIIQKDLKFGENGFIRYESDYIRFKITDTGISDLVETPDVEPPDSFFWHTTSYFPIDRDKVLNLTDSSYQWMDPFSADQPLREMIMNYIDEKRTGSDDIDINLKYLKDWGYDSDYLKVTNEGTFKLERKHPLNETDLSDGLQYLAPIWIVLEYLRNRLTNGIFIDLPEHGVFPPKACLLISNIIDDFVFRESDASDASDKEDYQPNIYLTTNSSYIISTILEYKELVGKIGLIIINGIPDEPLTYEVKSSDEETIQDVYDAGMDCFYNISAL